MLGAGFKKRVQQARYAGVAAPLVSLKWALEGTAKALAPSVIVAIGLNKDYRAGQNFLNPWIKLRSAAIVSDHFVSRHLAPANTLDDNETKAAIIGEITAVWSCQGMINDDSIQKARDYVGNNIILNPPDGQTLLACLNRYFTLLRNSPVTDVVSREDFCAALGIAVDNNMPDAFYKQKLLWFESRGNAIPWKLLTNMGAAYDIAINSLNNLTLGDYVVLDPLAMTLEPGWEVSWKAMTTSVGLSVLEMMCDMFPLRFRSIIVASAFATLAIAAKGANATDDWIIDRRLRLAKIDAQLQLDTWITPEIMERFFKLYPATKLTNDQVFRMLQAIYTWVHADDIGPFKWIIEQAAINHVTLALAFAEAVIRPTVNPIPFLAGILGVRQFENVATIAGWCIYDRFNSLVAPPLLMKEYADLAYIGKYISLTDKGKKTTAYLGEPTPYITKTETELKKIANAVLEGGLGGMDATELFQNTMAPVLAQMNYIIQDNEYYALAEPVHPGLGASQDAMDKYNEDLNNFHLARSGGKVKVGKVNIPATKVEPSRVFTEYNNRANAWSKSYLKIMSAFVTASQQIELPMPTDDRINESQRRKVIPQEILAHFQTCHINIPPAWTTVPNIDPVAPDDTLLETQLTILKRDTYYAPLLPGVRQPQPVAGPAPQGNVAGNP